MLKRKFENDGLPLKCYASDDKTITIMKAPAAQPKPAPQPKQHK